MKDMENIDFPFHSTDSPCNQNNQRSKTYRCKVSPSPIKAAACETCKKDVNHHGLSSPSR
jgi:hypothetical protein